MNPTTPTCTKHHIYECRDCAGHDLVDAMLVAFFGERDEWTPAEREGMSLALNVARMEGDDKP